MNHQGSVSRLQRISRTVTDIAKAVMFYTDALDFKQKTEATILDPAWAELLGIPGAHLQSIILQLGSQELELIAFDPPGCGYPANSSTTDLWFQHIAVVVADMDAAYLQLNHTPLSPISQGGPQHLPPNTGSVIAFKFRDPDGHPVELIHYPLGVGNPIWQQSSSRLFLGIDHSAIAIADTERSIDFYTRLLGFKLGSKSANTGSAQSRLDCARDVRVVVVALHPESNTPPHIELLHYEQPAGRPIPAGLKANDVAADRVVLQVHDLPRLTDSLVARNVEFISPGIVNLSRNQRAALIKDPTGRLLLLMDTQHS